MTNLDNDNEIEEDKFGSFSEDPEEEFEDDGLTEEEPEDDEPEPEEDDGFDEPEDDEPEDDDEFDEDEETGDAPEDNKAGMSKKVKYAIAAATVVTLGVVGALVFPQSQPQSQPQPQSVQEQMEERLRNAQSQPQPQSSPQPQSQSQSSPQSSPQSQPQSVQEQMEERLRNAQSQPQPQSSPQPQSQSQSQMISILKEMQASQKTSNAVMESLLKESVNTGILMAEIIKGYKEKKVRRHVSSQGKKAKAKVIRKPKYSRPSYEIKAINQGEAWVYSRKTKGKVVKLVDGSMLLGYGRVKAITPASGILTDAGYVNMKVAEKRPANRVKKSVYKSKNKLPVYRAAGVVDGTLWVYMKASPSARATVVRKNEGEELKGYGKIRAIYATGEVVAEKGRVRFEKVDK